MVNSSLVVQPPTSAVPVAVELSVLHRKAIEAFPTWSKSRIENINVDTDVDSCPGSPFLERVNDTLHPNAVNVSSFDNVKTATLVVLEVFLLVSHRRSDACMDRGIAN